MNKVLIVTYYWPPGSGAGVQRWLKFSRYLPEFGWEPVILTVNPDFATYPAFDKTLTGEISENLRVISTKATDWFRIYRRDKTKIPSAGFASDSAKGFSSLLARFIRGNFFIPDPRRGWNKYALKAASRLIESENITHVITTSPPHSTQLIGLRLKKKYPGLRWIADLRDPWTDIYYYKSFYHTRLAGLIDHNFELQVLRRADSIITVGKSLLETFAAKIPSQKGKISIISNGYDSIDFTGVTPPRPDIFTISYIGTLSPAYPLDSFIGAVRDLAGSGLKIRLVFAGVVSADQEEKLRSDIREVIIEFMPYLEHDKAIEVMRSSSLLLLIIPDHYSSRSIITGKLFEYLATGNPVFCLGPEDGDAAEILRTTGHGSCAGYADSGRIANIIRDHYNKGQDSPKSAPAEYSRRELTRKLALLLSETV
jgi:glycosyltransferase involved in cell wall biosynthesis